MDAAEIVIRAATAPDRAAWLSLWQGYLTFYEAAFSADHAEQLWQGLIDEADPRQCLVAETGGTLAGIVHFFPHPDTWVDRPVCYLQDLFVGPESRGRGIGTSLIRAVQNRARHQGWAHVYWQTAEDNTGARVLYDDLTGGPSGFIVYELPADGAD